MTTKTIAITGATGQFGAIALNLLKAKHANVIALVRNPAKISDVEARKFDYSKTEGQVEALQGVDTLILVSSNEIGQRFVQHNNVIEAAKKAGVKHIIYTSLLGATNDNTVKSLAGEYVETEAALKAQYAEGYLCEPHGAIAYQVLQDQLQAGETGIFLCTAHPAKFKESVERILDIELPLPEALDKHNKMELLSDTMPADFATLREYLLK